MGTEIDRQLNGGFNIFSLRLNCYYSFGTEHSYVKYHKLA
jgi:hypothetical protein